jgi:hypothetical protein
MTRIVTPTVTIIVGGVTVTLVRAHRGGASLDLWSAGCPVCGRVVGADWTSVPALADRIVGHLLWHGDDERRCVQCGDELEPTNRGLWCPDCADGA